MKFSNSLKSLVVIFALMFLVIVVSSKWLAGVRMDLSENGLYTLSGGTKKILDKLDQPVTLTLYFSDTATAQLPALRSYAQRVSELIEEYVGLANGKIVFKTIDPEPFSEAEDVASLAGLQGIPASTGGDKVYFGLVASNDSGAQQVIAFLQPDREQFLEYELTRLVSSLATTAKPKVGIYSGVEINGGFDFMTRQQRPAWSIMQFIEERFEVQWIEDNATKLEGFDVLLLIAPQQLSDSLLFAIDQFVLKGGRALVFLDPYAEAFAAQSAMPSVQRADLERLLPGWGLKLRPDVIVTDFANSMVVGVGPERNPVRHIGLMGLVPATIGSDDIVLHSLESLNLSTVGILDPQEGATTQVTPLIYSSDQAQPKAAEAMLQLENPESLLKDFAPTGERYLLAARLSGAVKTAFPEGVDVTVDAPDAEAKDEAEAETADGASEAKPKPKQVQHLAPEVLSADNVQVLVVADTDMLTDRLWIQVQNFFGQQVATPWADNGSFLMNALENMSGSPDLIEVRSQGQFTRPFTKVNELRRDAEERFLAQQGLLEEELTATEAKLVELERLRQDSDGAMFTPEQEQELASFQEEKSKIRKQLREVQHQLNQDIDALGMRLKIINIFLIPLLICIFVLVRGLRKR